ncbi:hypothetical protein B7486_39120 [cyanobacterium TDX16]|nr:hypothetical protein B7486_39120 [cyanobacterium TDX16]
MRSLLYFSGWNRLGSVYSIIFSGFSLLFALHECHIVTKSDRVRSVISVFKALHDKYFQLFKQFGLLV